MKRNIIQYWSFMAAPRFSHIKKHVLEEFHLKRFLKGVKESEGNDFMPNNLLTLGCLNARCCTAAVRETENQNRGIH